MTIPHITAEYFQCGITLFHQYVKPIQIEFLSSEKNKSKSAVIRKSVICGILLPSWERLRDYD